jgi:hypothetical protein
MHKYKPVTFILVTILLFVVVIMPRAIAGSLEPSAPPAPTMKTLDQLSPTWGKQYKASERFEGLQYVCDPSPSHPVCTVGIWGALDHETGLVWELVPTNSSGPGIDWADAQSTCSTKEVGGRYGWRVPTVEELSSLIDPRESGPALPDGHPFNLGGNPIYWTATTLTSDPTRVYVVDIGAGTVDTAEKNPTGLVFVTNVWCVRGGYGYDAH